MVDWKKIKADITKGLKEGAETVKDGADIVAKKAGEVSAESQRKVKVFNKKRHIQDFMEELGAAIYQAEKSNPGSVSDDASKGIIEKLDQANTELEALEKKAAKDES